MLPLDYVKICKDAIAVADGLELDIPKPHNIIFAGMGGGGIPGNLIKDVTRLDIPIEVSKGYNLPPYADSNSLVICTGYSGNTEETLSQFAEAVKRKCSIISISSGGKALEWSKKLGVPFIHLPSGYLPREGLPYLFFASLACLEKLNLVNFLEDKQEFLDLIPKIDLSKIDKIAASIKDSIPVIYGSSDFSGVLRRIKCELNENSKMVAKFEELPELNHNEVVGYEMHNYHNISIVFLRDEDEDQRLKKRIEVTKEIAQDKVKVVHEIWSYGKSKLAKVMSLVYQGDYLSLKLAELKGLDWRQMKTIDKVKEELKSLNTVEKLERELGFIS